MSPNQTTPLSQVHAYLKTKDKGFTADLPTFEKDMQDSGTRQQVYDYLKGQDKGFTASFDDFSNDLGVKKKDQPDSGNVSGVGAEADKPFVNAPPSAADSVPPMDPAMQAEADGLALKYDAGQIDTASLHPGLLQAPGDEYAAAGVPLPTGEQMRADTEAKDLSGLAALPGTTNPDVRPVVNKNALGDMPVPLDYGHERVVVPKNYEGVLPKGTHTDPKTGQRYFDRLMDDKVDGKTQTAYEGAKALFMNSLKEMGQGAIQGVSAFANATSGMPYDDSGDVVSARIEAGKDKVSDRNARSGVSLAHPESLLLKSGEYAPLVFAQVAQTLAPEARVGTAVSKAIGLLSTAAFDAQMMHGAAENAKKARLKGQAAAYYTLFEGTLTLAGFKTGSKLMGALGDKLAMKIAPDAAREAIALDAAKEVAALEARAGRQATATEVQTILHGSLRKSMPGIMQIPKEMLQQGPVFAGVEGVKMAANQVAAPALGGTADGLSGGEVLNRLQIGLDSGLAMGAITGGLGAALGTGRLAPEQPQSGINTAETAPAIPEQVRADPSVVDVTGQAPEAIPAEAAVQEPAPFTPNEQPAASEPPTARPGKSDVAITVRPPDAQDPGKQGFNVEVNTPDGAEAGRVFGDVRPDGTMRILNSGVADNTKGQGYGIAMYEAMADHAAANGLKLTSDVEVTQDAANMYDALARRGYTVERNPAAELTDVDGEQKWVSKDGPVFTVTGEPTAAVDAIEELPGTKDRKSMVSLDNAPQIGEPLKAAVKESGLDKYEPRSQKEAEKTVDDHLATLTTPEAVAHAIRGDVKNSDVRTILRIKTMERVSNEIDAAEQAGDTEAVTQLSKDALAVADAYAKTLTDAGQGISAARLMNRYAPTAVVHVAEKDVAEMGEKAAKKEVPKERKKINAERAVALDNTLASKAVKAAREKLTGKTPATTKERIAEAKAERADLFEKLKKLKQQVNIIPQTEAEAQLHVDIFKSYIKEGVLRVRDLVERFKKEGGAMVRGVDDATLAKRATAALNDHKTATDSEVSALNRTIDQIARDHSTDAAAVGKSLADKFVEGAGLDPVEAKKLADAIEAEFATRIAAARQKRIDELNKRAAAPSAKRAAATDLQKTQELFTLSPTSDAAIIEHLKRTTKIPTLTPADAANLRALAKKVQQAPEGFQKDAAVGELLKAQAKIKGISKLEVAGAIWYANILAALKTHGINIFANTGQLIMEPAVSLAHNTLRGRPSVAVQGLRGLGKGLARGARESYSSFTTGREVATHPGKYDIPSVLEYINFKGGKLNPYNYAKYVGRALRSMDMLFSTGLREMRAYELATTEALADKKNGVPGPEIWERVAEKLYNTKGRIADAETQAKAEGLTGNDYKRRVFEIAEQSRPVELVDESREYGTRAVFNGDPKGAAATVANGIASIANDISIGGVKPVKLIVPFTRVVSNVANAYLDYTPLGAIRAANSLIRAKSAGSEFGGAHVTAGEESSRQRLINGEERERLLIRSVVGAGAMAALYALSHDKDEKGNPTIEVTGNGTGDVQKDMQLKSQGWMPNSIKYQGTYYGFANTPFALIGAFVGNVNDGETYRKEKIASDDAAANNVSKAAFQTLVGIGDITAARGPRDFLQATRTPDAFQSYLRRMAASTATSALPMSNLVNETAGYFYENRKEAHTLSEAMARNIPGARNGLNSSVDVLGDPLPAKNPRLWNQVPVRDEQTEKLWSALKKHGLFISVPSKAMGGTLVVRPEQGTESPMDDQEFYDFMALRGKYLKMGLLSHMDVLEGSNKVAAETVLHNISQLATQQAKQERFGQGGFTTIDRLQRQQAASGSSGGED